jgi:hypothetical protein
MRPAKGKQPLSVRLSPDDRIGAQSIQERIEYSGNLQGQTL